MSVFKTKWMLYALLAICNVTLIRSSEQSLTCKQRCILLLQTYFLVGVRNGKKNFITTFKTMANRELETKFQTENMSSYKTQHNKILQKLFKGYTKALFDQRPHSLDVVINGMKLPGKFCEDRALELMRDKKFPKLSSLSNTNPPWDNEELKKICLEYVGKLGICHDEVSQVSVFETLYNEISDDIVSNYFKLVCEEPRKLTYQTLRYTSYVREFSKGFFDHYKTVFDDKNQNDEYSYLSLDCYCENEGRKIVHDVIDPEPLIDKNEHSTMSHLLEDTQISID